ncbi:hypothetical protein BH10PSE2_BH10PSE2_12960 [soil metagenome]
MSRSPIALMTLSALTLSGVAGGALAQTGSQGATRSLNQGAERGSAGIYVSGQYQAAPEGGEPEPTPPDYARQGRPTEYRRANVSDAGLAIGVNVGTTGGGAAIEARVGPLFVLRGGIETLGVDLNRSYGGVDYTGRFDFNTVSGFLDLHPLANAFFVSGGAYVGDRSVDLDATPSAPVTIGGQSFTPAQVGTLSGQIKLKQAAPFLGLGYDNTFTGLGRWGFRATAGVAWSQDPKVSLDSTGGTLSNDPTFRARLAEEERNIQSDAEDYGLFPVLQAGLNYRF